MSRVSGMSGDYPFSLPRAYLLGRPAVCCSAVLPVCPCIVSFSNFYGPDTHDFLRTLSRSRGSYEENAPVEFQFMRVRQVGLVKQLMCMRNRDFLGTFSWLLVSRVVLPGCL